MWLTAPLSPAVVAVNERVESAASVAAAEPAVPLWAVVRLAPDEPGRSPLVRLALFDSLPAAAPGAALLESLLELVEVELEASLDLLCVAPACVPATCCSCSIIWR